MLGFRGLGIEVFYYYYWQFTAVLLKKQAGSGRQPMMMQPMGTQGTPVRPMRNTNTKKMHVAAGRASLGMGAQA